VAFGALLAVIGVAFWIWPFFAASWLFAILIGASLIAAGGASLSRRRSGGASPLGGLTLIALGGLAVVFSDFTVRMLVAFLGTVLIGIGVLWILISLALRRGGAGLGMLPGLLLLAAGVFAILWPSAALVIAAIAIGLILIGIGVTLIAGGARLRRLG